MTCQAYAHLHCRGVTGGGRGQNDTAKVSTALTRCVVLACLTLPRLRLLRQQRPYAGRVVPCWWRNSG